MRSVSWSVVSAATSPSRARSRILRTYHCERSSASSATARVAVPRDALSFHLAILNALEQFAAALNTLAANADDPLAAVVVLRAFNQAETNVLTSFASLAKYYREKQT